jgi:hypothetical protein
MNSRISIHFAFFLFAAVAIFAQSNQKDVIDVKLAKQYFKEAEQLCNNDDGELWGINLYGPMMFVDKKTRTTAANYIDEYGVFKREGEIYLGTLPDSVMIANTAISWGGKEWSVYLWSLNNNEFKRKSLLIHELWHRVQDSIGFHGRSMDNNHLDKKDGRIYLILELRALGKALTTEQKERRSHTLNALAFREYRRSLYSGAAESEVSLEMHEGLAEYTGIKLCGVDNPNQFTADMLKEREDMDSFVRGFAYLTGPAYGFLLDDLNVNWRNDLKPSDDLGVILASAVDYQSPEDLKLFTSREMSKYDGNKLIEKETEREQKRIARLKHFRKLLIEQPHLKIKLGKFQMQMNPQGLIPLDTAGTVYPEIKITAKWGVLNTSKGALIDPNFQTVSVPQPESVSENQIEGEGYKLELKEGWELKSLENTDNFTLVKNRN